MEVEVTKYGSFPDKGLIGWPIRIIREQYISNIITVVSCLKLDAQNLFLLWKPLEMCIRVCVCVSMSTSEKYTSAVFLCAASDLLSLLIRPLLSLSLTRGEIRRPSLYNLWTLMPRHTRLVGVRMCSSFFFSFFFVSGWLSLRALTGRKVGK